MDNYWTAFLKGENNALGSLYTDIFEPLVFRAISYTKDPEVARDIVSQLFMELVAVPKKARLERWKKVRDPKSFLAVIVRNKCLDHVRVFSNRQRLHKRLAEEAEVNVNEDDEMDFSIKLQECVSTLTDHERKLLKLHLNGYRNADIAHELKLSEKTVRNRLSLTRKMLAVRWQELFILITVLWSSRS